jgi:alanine dehydrogenase
MQLDDMFGGRVRTIMYSQAAVRSAVLTADLLIGAVLLPGAKAPKLVTEEMVKTMRAGSVIIDVSIDQCGCIATADTITYHDKPTYIKHGVVHYAVANMPGAVPRTSTLALTSVTLPYAIKLANEGVLKAAASDEALKKGVNVYNGHLTYQPVAVAQGKAYTPYEQAIK